MLKRIALVAVITLSAFTAAPGFGQAVDFRIDKVYGKDFGVGVEPPFPAALVTVTNKNDYPLSHVLIKCTWLKDGVPVSTGPGRISNLQPGQTDTTDLWSSERPLFDSARCRVTRVIR